jgi:hypothetical protein
LIDWHKPVEWISDPIGYVFLPRAMLQVGQALFSDEWTGAEPATPVFLPLPVRSAAAPEWQKREAHVALCKERPDFGRKPEADAIRHLADKLKENPDMTREEAHAECARFAITKRGFLHRVFPKAREKAGLPATASAGRKRNNRSAKSKR